MSAFARLLERPWVRIAFGFVMLAAGAVASELGLTASAVLHLLIGVYFIVSGMLTLER